MALVTANQFDTTARPALFGQGVIQGQQIAANRQALGQAQAAAQRQQQLGQFSQQAIAGDSQALGGVAGIDPQKARNIQQFLASQTDAERAETLRENDALTKNALIAQSLDPGQVRPFLERQRNQAKLDGRSTERVDRALAGTDDQLRQDIDFQAREGQTIAQLAKQQFPGLAPTGTASQRDFETFQRLKQTDPAKAEVFGRQAGFVRETPRELAEIDISKTERKEIIRKRVARTSDIRTELSERNRGAARSARTLRQALTLAETASQGLSGTAKLQLSRLLPGIDATNEAVLDSTLKQLALEQLQLFKGPTTDFEFGVTQSITGALGQSKEANIARIKSLDRARFFNEREIKQFNQHVKDGGDPDNFSFNFSEIIKTKKGPFSLQDIQDTAVQNNLTIDETIQRLNR